VENMQIARTDFVAVIRKWQEERRLIHCKYYDVNDEITGSVIGRIEEVGGSKVRVDARSMHHRGELTGVELDFAAASLAVFGPETVPKELAASLRGAYDVIVQATLPSGSICQLHSLKLSSEIDGI
jgi:hypothetical protein